MISNGDIDFRAKETVLCYWLSMS